MAPLSGLVQHSRPLRIDALSHPGTRGTIKIGTQITLLLNREDHHMRFPKWSKESIDSRKKSLLSWHILKGPARMLFAGKNVSLVDRTTDLQIFTRR